jgi:SRSO17 transposase
MSNPTFQRLIVNTIAATLLTGVIAGQATADTIWRYPYKGAPYAVPHEHNDQVSPEREATKSASKPGRRNATGAAGKRAPRIAPVPRRTSAAMPSEAVPVILANHKPGYHVGLPRKGKGKSAPPQPRHRSPT